MFSLSFDNNWVYKNKGPSFQFKKKKSIVPLYLKWKLYKTQHLDSPLIVRMFKEGVFFLNTAITKCMRMGTAHKTGIYFSPFSNIKMLAGEAGWWVAFLASTIVPYCCVFQREATLCPYMEDGGRVRKSNTV